jgi:aryl-alcohol dehydrogenase-like predicted oxidoreductase
MGRTGLLVSRVCLGTMTFGAKDWGCDLNLRAMPSGPRLEKKRPDWRTNK